MRSVLLCVLVACSGSHRSPPAALHSALEVDAAVAADEPAPPADRPAVALIVRTNPDPKKLEAGAVVRPGEPLHARGRVESATAVALTEHRADWTLVLEVGGVDTPVHLELPDELALPLTVGANVTVDFTSHGGGPNRIASLLVLDDHGGVLVAINQVPDGWHADHGRTLSVEKDEGYDTKAQAVKLGPKGTDVELTTDWRAVKLAGHRYYGYGAAAQRTLHGRGPAPPDYVADWLDFALVRVDATP